MNNNKQRKIVVLVILILVFVSIAFYYPSFGIKSFLTSGVTFNPSKVDVAFTIMFTLIALYGLGFSLYRLKINSLIRQDVQLVEKYSSFLSKSWLWVPFNWNIILIYFSFRRSNSIALKRMARNLIILSIVWIALEVALFMMILFFYSK
jgi:hypothetical protein